MQKSNDLPYPKRTIGYALAHLIQISRPIGWLLFSGVVAIGMSYGRTEVSARSVMLLAIFSVPYCLWLFGWNDLYDQESDRLNPRKGSWVHGAQLRPELEKLLRSALWGSLAVTVTTSFFFPFITTLLVLSAFLLGLVYSAKPVRLKEIPFLDGYWFAATVWLLFAAGFSLRSPINQIPLEIYFYLPAFVGIHLNSTVLDYESDKEAGQLTFATRFGKRLTFLISAFFTALSVIAMPFVNYAKPVAVVLIAQFLTFTAFYLFPDRMPYRYCWRLLIGLNSVCGLILIFL